MAGETTIIAKQKMGKIGEVRCSHLNRVRLQVRHQRVELVQAAQRKKG
jgi:hypothetical protein